MDLWEKAGMSRFDFVRLPYIEKSKIIRRFNGIKIFTECEIGQIKNATSNPVRHLFNLWCEENAERHAIKENYPHAIFG